MVAQLAEVLLAEAEERRAVELGVASHRVVGVRMERVALAVVPDLLRLVAALDVHPARIPVGLLPGDEVAALEEEDALAGGGQGVSQRPAAGAGADDDDVVAVHGTNLRSGPGQEGSPPVCGSPTTVTGEALPAAQPLRAVS